MKKAMLMLLLLCSATLTGCFYDDNIVEAEPSAFTTETMPETTLVTEADTTEATEPCSPTAPSEAPMEMTIVEAEPLAELDPTEPTEEMAEEETTEDIQPLTGTEPSETELPSASIETEPIPQTEPITEPELSNYDKASEVYAYMLENGHGTCVNYACQTYEKCKEIGLPCYIVWTDAQLYGHVANTVQVDGIWFILDTQGKMFLTYNYGFTEVIDMDMNHIGNMEMLSNQSFAEIQI